MVSRIPKLICVSDHHTSCHAGEGKFIVYTPERLRSSGYRFALKKNLRRIKGTLHEDLRMFMIISNSVLLRMGNVSDQCRRDYENTHFLIFFDRASQYNLSN